MRRLPSRQSRLCRDGAPEKSSVVQKRQKRRCDRARLGTAALVWWRRENQMHARTMIATGVKKKRLLSQECSLPIVQVVICTAGIARHNANHESGHSIREI